MKAILLDDEPMALEGMERMLRKQQVQVCAAFTNPFEAVAQAPSFEADVAFVDIELPGMSGLEAARRLKRADPGLHIVFVTAYDQYAVQAFERDATDYLLKPVQTKRLATTLARISERGRPGGEKRVAAAAAAPAPSMLCCFRQLGWMDAEGRVWEIPWRTAKAKEVFSYLLHMRNRAVSKDFLIELIWPEFELFKAQTHLHTTMYQIRQTLKAAEIPVKLAFVDGSYRLELQEMHVDVDVWESASPVGDGKDRASGRTLHQWMGWYRGDYFELEGYWWAEQERERLRLRWWDYALLAAAQPPGTEGSSERYALLLEMIRRYPLAQQSYWLLMKLYHTQGQAADVRKTYEHLRLTLLEEAGELPNEEIEAWFKKHVGRKG